MLRPSVKYGLRMLTNQHHQRQTLNELAPIDRFEGWLQKHRPRTKGRVNEGHEVSSTQQPVCHAWCPHRMPTLKTMVSKETERYRVLCPISRCAIAQGRVAIPDRQERHPLPRYLAKSRQPNARRCLETTIRKRARQTNRKAPYRMLHSLLLRSRLHHPGTKFLLPALWSQTHDPTRLMACRG
jgi:hypothetical protein